MWLEAGQVAAEAAKQGGVVTVAIPTAFISSIVTLLGREALAFFVGKRKRNGNGGPKPGAGETCRKHGEDIAMLVEFKGNADDAPKRIEGKVDRLLERK